MSENKVKIESEEDVNKIIASGGSVVESTAPLYFASQMRLGMSPTECTLTFLRPKPAQLVKDGAVLADLGRLESVAIVQMTPAAMKDLMVLLRDQIASYEAQWGEIKSEFTSGRSGSGKGSA